MAIGPGCHFQSVRDQKHGKQNAAHLIDGQRGTVQRDRPFFCDKPCGFLRGFELEVNRVRMIFAFDHCGDTVNMPEHQMTTKFRTQGQGPLQIDPLTCTPVRDRRQCQGFGGRFDIKPVSVITVRLCRYRVTNTSTGDRGPDIERVRVIRRANACPLAGRYVLDR